MKLKNKKAIIFISILVAMTAAIIIRPLNNLDELWNYNFANNIANGRIPYKDFNMIQTPLLPIICGSILKILGNELIIMRILAIFLNTAIFFISYRILETLKINKYFILLSLAGMYLLYFNYFCIDYNFMVLFIGLLGLYVELKDLNKNGNFLKLNIKKDLLLGIIIGSSILFKQTTGLWLSLIYIFYKLLIIREKEKIRVIGKIISVRIVGVIIPVILLLIYLITNKIFIEFLDYAVCGIKTFDNQIHYIELLITYEIPVKILSILIPMTIIYMFLMSVIKKQKKIEQRNIFILFAYSVACFIVVFPISDSIHFLIGSMPALISLIYILTLMIRRLNLKPKTYIFVRDTIKTISIMMIVIVLITAVILIVDYISNYKNFSNMKHYKFIISNLDNRISEVDNYILEQNFKGKNVYILDATSSLYMIPLDKYNKNYDMFLVGNLGGDGENGQIKNLQKEEDAIVLIMNDNYARNWQNPEKVRKYIIENWNKTGEILNFDIYEK